MTIEEYQKDLAAHDWTYEMSDDHAVWKLGRHEHIRLVYIADHNGDDFKRAYNVAFAKQFHREPFCKPWNLPYPNTP